MKIERNTLLILIATIMMFGIGWPISKVGLQYMPPITFSAIRLVLGTVLMFIIVITTRNFIWPGRKDLPIIFAIGILQVGIFMTFIHLGLNLISAGRSTLLAYTTPIWVTPIAILIFKESAGPLKWLGLILGMCGMVTLFGPWGVDWSDPQALLGNFFLLLAAWSWAIAILCARYMKWHHTPLELLPWQLLVGTIPVLFLMLLELPLPPTTWNIPLISTLLFVGIFPQGFGMLGVIMVSKALPSITTSLCLLAVPVTGILLSWLLLGEQITSVNMMAIGLIMISLLCTALDEKYRRQTSSTNA